MTILWVFIDLIFIFGSTEPDSTSKERRHFAKDKEMYLNRKNAHGENDKYKKNKPRLNEEAEELKSKKPMQKSEYMAMAFGVQPKEIEYSKYSLFVYSVFKM